MYGEYNAQLDELRGRIARGEKINAMLRDLSMQESQLKARVEDLLRELSSEQADVDRVSGGFMGIFYALTGQKKELLDKERAEVLKASMKYDTARAELERVQREISRLSQEKRALEDCEREYRILLDQKRQAMRGSGETGARLMALEEKKRYLDTQLREVDEATLAGRRAVEQIAVIERSLNSAENWGTWDLISRGGLITHVAKHSHLDEAQRGVRRLEQLLRDFHTELADVTIQADIHAQVDGFLRFADWFFDGLFVDWAVLSRIGRSKENLENTRRQVEQVLNQLTRMRQEMVRQRDRLEQEIQELVRQA